jgi:hypothetical protein
MKNNEGTNRTDLGERTPPGIAAVCIVAVRRRRFVLAWPLLSSPAASY